jgi:hypothetical protein
VGLCLLETFDDDDNDATTSNFYQVFLLEELVALSSQSTSTMDNDGVILRSMIDGVN